MHTTCIYTLVFKIDLNASYLMQAQRLIQQYK